MFTDRHTTFLRLHPADVAPRAFVEGDHVRFTVSDWESGETDLDGVVTRMCDVSGHVGVRVEAGSQTAVYLVPADALALALEDRHVR